MNEPWERYQTNIYTKELALIYLFWEGLKQMFNFNLILFYIQTMSLVVDDVMGGELVTDGSHWLP